MPVEYNPSMPLDKELYRWAYEQYQQWNEAELIDRALNAGRLSPQKAWRQYVALWEFALKISPPPSESQRQQRIKELQTYYDNILEFETWRSRHGHRA